jgi:hypothetical protein
MASYAGPNAVSGMQGLICSLDVSNSKCYTGSQTSLINLGNSDLNFSGTTSSVSSSSITGHLSSGLATAVTDILNTDYHSIFFKIRFNSTATYPESYTGGWDKIFGFDANTDRSPGIWRWPGERSIHWRYDPSNSGCDFGKTGAGTGNQFDLNTWYFVGVTTNGSTAISYVNGVAVSTQSVSFPKTAGSGQIRIFGGYSGDKPGITSLNNLYIFNRVLSPIECKSLFDILRPQLGI